MEKVLGNSVMPGGQQQAGAELTPTAGAPPAAQVLYPDFSCPLLCPVERVSVLQKGKWRPGSAQHLFQRRGLMRAWSGTRPCLGQASAPAPRAGLGPRPGVASLDPLARPWPWRLRFIGKKRLQHTCPRAVSKTTLN